MKKVRIAFYEIEHEGDVCEAMEALVRLGGQNPVCVERNFEDAEEAVIEVDVEDPKAFRLAAREAELCCY